MTCCVSLRQIAHLRVSMPADDRWVEDIGWLPVSTSEIHLVSRYFPLAMRISGRRRQLGLLLNQRYLVSALLGPSGRWCGGYRPIALRCYPFDAPELADDPLTDIIIDPKSKYLSPTAGIPIVDEAGQPNGRFIEMHRHFGLLARSQEALCGILDQYSIAGLLVPLPTDDDSQPLYVIDPARFDQIDNMALSAMARRSFQSIDIAVSWLFSLQALKPEHLPKQMGRSRTQRPAPGYVQPDPVLMDDLSLVLDDGELVSLANIAIPQSDGRPASPHAPV